MNLLFALLLVFSNPSDKIKIIDPWMRVGAQGQATGLFFKIENNSEKADTLYKVEFELAGKVEIHETYDAGDDMMGMREVGQFVIPAKSCLTKVTFCVSVSSETRIALPVVPEIVLPVVSAG